MGDAGDAVPLITRTVASSRRRRAPRREPGGRPPRGQWAPPAFRATTPAATRTRPPYWTGVEAVAEEGRADQGDQGDAAAAQMP
ncbi:hypothetical protein ACW23B_17215 [Streptomyces albidoflavus]